MYLAFSVARTMRALPSGAGMAGKGTGRFIPVLSNHDTNPVQKRGLPDFGVAVTDIEVVFGRENVNKQLRIKTPRKLPAVFMQPSLLPDEGRHMSGPRRN